MKKVGIIFGGRSVEHEVSVITAMQIIENIDKTKYEPVAIYIDKEGRWLTGDSLLEFENYKADNFIDAKEIIISPNYKDNNLYGNPERLSLFGKKILNQIDIAFPAIHGTNGEDGTIQGLFELIDIPYVGAGVLGSSVGMDKILMKDVYKANGLPIVDYYWFYRTRWEREKDLVIEEIEDKLSYPLFVKPANLGSSIGISKAKDKEGLIKSIEVAINYDRKIIVEQAVEKPREINCAVMGYDEEVITSLCEEPLGWEDILSFEDKYIKSNEKGGKSSGERRIIPADIRDNMREEIEALAKKAFTTIDTRGVSRIDFLVDQEEKIYINEINTLPGSISFYLWEGKGYHFEKLISELIHIAIKVHEEKGKNTYSYEANLLNRVNYGSKLK